ncbi:MAG TPA: hypothetical protein PLG31_20080, partial [Spirochaetota bacterium]|nr:hypothetical protein [Spirochaetota bacterium]
MLLLENRTQIQETPAREVDATKRVQVVACPRPFSMAKTITYVREGMTIREILDAIGVRFHPGIECRVFINDLLVPEWWWDRVRPKAGALFGVRVVPAGGDDGGKKNGVLMAVVAIVAVVAAVFTAGLSLAAMNVTWATATAGQAAIAAGAGALAGAAVSFAGALAV